MAVKGTVEMELEMYGSSGCSMSLGVVVVVVVAAVVVI